MILEARAKDPESPRTSGVSPRGLLPFREKGRSIFILVWVLSAAYVFPYRNRGWIPHDEGVLGQSAEHVLKGELPHRDFPEIYTGGLSYWNALAFRLFGLKLTSIRLILFLSFVAFVPAAFGIASRFGPPLVAGAVTLLAVAWSLPNYFAAIPSWYNLFLAAWAVLALLRHIETGRKRWLFLAGVFAGVSCLFKVIGAHIVAASLLFLLYRERELSAPSRLPVGSRRVSGYFLFLTAGLALFLAVVFQVVRSHLAGTEFVYFLLPPVTVCGFLIWREFSKGGGSFPDRLRVLTRLVLPLATGTLLPIILFLVTFALQGALAGVGRGILAGTGAHVQFVRMWLPPLSGFLPALPYTIILAAGSLRRFRFAGLLLLLLAAMLALALWLSGSSPGVYRVVWNSARSLGAAAVFAACLRLSDSHQLGFWSAETRQKVFLLTAVIAITCLVQFPFGAPIYFCYFAPLVALQIFALVGSESRPPRLLHTAVLIFYLLFAALRMNPGYVWGLGHRFERYDPRSTLGLPRAGRLLVTAKDAEDYGSLIPLLQVRSGGRPIYAGPNSPEIYFLSGLDDVVTYGPASPLDPMQRPEELLRALGEKGTRAVVVSRRSTFATGIPQQVLARFKQLFPHWRAIGNFVLCWKE